MPWFPVDDSFYSHPKALAASLAARGLWVTAGSWSSAHLTDGVVPVHVLGSLGGTPELAAELVAAGLWKRTKRGYVFNDWLEWGSKRTAAETRELRKARQAAGKKGGVASGKTRSKNEAKTKQLASPTVRGGLNPQSLYTNTALSQPEPFLGARDHKSNFSDVKSNSQANRLPSAIPYEALRDPSIEPGHQPAADETVTAIAAQARQALNGRTT